jgi:prevent-host-death family protein
VARIVNMHEAKSDLSRLVGQALAGEEVIIARAGTPVVRLTPLRQARVPGSAKGLVRIEPTFYDPLPEEIAAAFEGR